METNDLNRGVNILQGLLNAAAREEARKPAAPAPSEASLPGFETEVSATEPPAPESILEKAPADAPADKRATDERPSAARVSVAHILTALAVAACAGISAVVAYKFIVPRTIVKEVVKEVKVEPDGMPLALLPESADPELWDTVANMHGTVNGADLAFSRGLAAADGAYWHLVLDFCRAGNTVYAKVRGDGKGTWVVRVSADGRILKAQPWKHGDKPLKALFAH